MLDRNVYGAKKLRLHKTLQHVINADFKFLVNIKIDEIGRLIELQCVPSPTIAAKLEYYRHINVS